MRELSSAAGTAASIALMIALESCGSQGALGTRKDAAQAQAQLAAKPGSADVTTTTLADANYSTRALLAARKTGLASESAELADPSKTGTIDAAATDPYNAANYPDVVRRWGKLVPAINRERRLAAAIAARDPRCDGVVNAQITDHGGRSDRHYMTECNNLTRIYFDAKSLAGHRAALVRTEADLGAQGIPDW
jgi:hypothetical protein